MRVVVSVVAFVIFLIANAVAQECKPSAAVSVDMEAILKDAGIEHGAIKIIRLSDGRAWQAGGERLRQRFVAASTSKIPHTLIALDAGAVSSGSEIFEWDGVERFVSAWNKNQSFKEAFANSTVWIYQQTVQRISREVIRDYLERFDYGSADIGPPEARIRYWLDGPLTISLEEQLAFLRRLATRGLDLKASTYDEARNIMQVETGEGADGARWTLFAKSGWAHRDPKRADQAAYKSWPEKDTGWYVGWVEREDGCGHETYVFAMNMRMDYENWQADISKRKEAMMAGLRAVNALSD